MSNELFLLLLGWLLGVVSSLLTSFVMFLLEGRRAIRLEILKQRQEDIRLARNWADEGKKISLRGFNLSGANLSGKDFTGADLEDVNLEGAHLWATDFTNANLRRANFRKAKIVGVKLTKANLLLADFTGSIIGDTDFSGAQLHRTNLEAVKEIKHCTWDAVQIDETTQLSAELRQNIREQP